MSRCELSGKGPVVGNLVSHSNIKTKSISQPNVQYKKLHSQALNSSFTLKVAASTIRSIEHVGGFDSFILKATPNELSVKAKDIKRRILKRLSGKKKTAKAATETVTAAAPVAAPKAKTVKKTVKAKAKKK